MLLTKDTLIDLILYTRRLMNLPTDEQTVIFIRCSETENVRQIWEGLEELARIFQNFGQRTFAYYAA
ncbi:MAG: hypothetical protein ABIH38_03255 [Patescibacteria group bacterium]